VPRLVRSCAFTFGLVSWAVACASFSEDESSVPFALDGAADRAAPKQDAGALVQVRDDASAADAADAAVPSMVVITTATNQTFAIDAREVTVGQFAAFKATQPTDVAFPDCPGKTALGPNAKGTCSGSTDQDQPVTCVDWCDAKVYCAAAGKRLCGKIGGGRPVAGTENDPTVDQWARACMGDKGSRWPYGGQAQTQACNTAEAARGSAVSVGSYAQCVGGAPDLFDMSGNVDEWEDACVARAGGAECLLRGGSFKHPVTESSCDYLLLSAVTSTYDDVGFRCCKDL
jgi:formylglycine-generating enzyme required for sulfatase activity